MENRNHTIALLLNSMAGLLSTRGANPYRVRAYRHAADSLVRVKEDIGELAQQGDLQRIPGIGKELSAKIEEFLSTGTIRAYEELTLPLPSHVKNWKNLPGFSEPLIHDLYYRLKIRTLDDLEKLVRSHLLRTLPGMDQPTQELLAALQTFKEQSSEEQRTHTNSPRLAIS